MRIYQDTYDEEERESYYEVFLRDLMKKIFPFFSFL